MFGPGTRLWLARWGGLLLLAGAVVPVACLEPYATGPPIRGEALGAHLWTHALLRGGGLEAFAEEAGLVAEEGRYRNPHPPGVALLRLPAMALLVDRREEAPAIGAAEHTAASLCGAAALLALAWLALSTCYLLGAPPGASAVALATVVFGAGLFHTATHDGAFPPIYSALGVALLLWLGARALVRGRGSSPVFGLVVFALLLVQPANLLVVLALSSFWLVGPVWHGRAGAGPLVAAACAAVAAVTVFTALGGARWTWSWSDSAALLPIAVVLVALGLASLPWWANRLALVGAFVVVVVGGQLMLGRWAGTLPSGEVSAAAWWSHVVGERSLLGRVARWLERGR